MGGMKKGFLAGAGAVAGILLAVFAALYMTGFFGGPALEEYRLADGVKTMRLEAVVYGGKLYVPVDALSFLQGREASVDKAAKKITFGAADGAQPAVSADTARPEPSATPARKPPEALAVAIEEDADAFNQKYGGDIFLKCDKEVVYINGSDEWQWTVSVSSASGKSIEIDRIDQYYRTSTDYSKDVKRSYANDDLISAWGKTVFIENGSEKTLSTNWGGASGNDVAYVDYFAYGWDEDGNEIHGCVRILLSKEVRK